MPSSIVGLIQTPSFGKSRPFQGVHGVALPGCGPEGDARGVFRTDGVHDALPQTLLGFSEGGLGRRDLQNQSIRLTGVQYGLPVDELGLDSPSQPDRRPAAADLLDAGNLPKSILPPFGIAATPP